MWCGIRRFRRQPDRCLRIGFYIETDGLGAVKWAWEEGEKHGIMESQFHTALPELTVRSSLEQTLREVSRLRGVEMNVLAKAIKRNFRRFVWGDNTGQKEENR